MTKELNAALVALLSRKFLVSVLALLLVTFAIQLDAQTKLTTITWIVGLFGGANVAEKALTK